MAKEKNADAAHAAAEGKSIVNPKYRDKYKTPDWLAATIAKYATTTKTKKVTEGEGDAKTTKEVTVPGGVDVEALFALAKANGLDVSKYESQRDAHGFAGRFRMTVRNMLQATVKARHGLFDPSGKWIKADESFLRDKGAPEAPTHDQTGEKFAVKEKKAA